MEAVREKNKEEVKDFAVVVCPFSLSELVLSCCRLTQNVNNTIRFISLTVYIGFAKISIMKLRTNKITISTTHPKALT